MDCSNIPFPNPVCAFGAERRTTSSVLTKHTAIILSRLKDAIHLTFLEFQNQFAPQGLTVIFLPVSDGGRKRLSAAGQERLSKNGCGYEAENRGSASG
jgi:hypothetical protein